MLNPALAAAVCTGYAFVGEPETNGVIERLFRTLKEQIVHGRVFQTIDEVRDAVREVTAQPGTRTDLPCRMARMAWNASMPRRAAVPMTDRAAA